MGVLEEETFEKFGYYPGDLKPKSNKKIICACDECAKVRILRKADYKPLCASCTRRGRRNTNWQGGKVKLICQTCGINISVDPCDVKYSKGKFCSLRCRSKWRSEHQRGKKSPLWKEREKRICQTCGAEFPIESYRIKYGGGKFCSTACMGKWQSENLKGENSFAWKGGISFEPYCNKFNFAFKEYIRNKFGRVCFLCQKTETENGQRLSVHHVNYNKDCGCDDDETCQFVPLCRSCNSEVNSKREEWEAKIKAKMRNKLNGWYI